jgi:hypothetical protein
VQLDFEVTDPGELLWGRRLLRGWAEIRGMGGEDTDDVLIAIGEAGMSIGSGRGGAPGRGAGGGSGAQWLDTLSGPVVALCVGP